MSAHEKPPHTTQPTAPDTLYASGAVHQDFTFNDRVAEVFDDMLNRSIPYYRTVIEGMAQLLAARLPDGATVCDLGCSGMGQVVGKRIRGGARGRQGRGCGLFGVQSFGS